MTYGGPRDDVFTIHPVTGVISTTRSLDRETKEDYTVTGTERKLLIFSIIVSKENLSLLSAVAKWACNCLIHD